MSRRWPTTPASRSTRSTARRACTPPASPVPTATYDDNVAKLLAALDGVPPDAAPGPLPHRRRRALCPDGREVVAEGAVEGTIADARRGSGGFGYDPVFVPDDGDGRTFAEMSPPRSTPSPTGPAPSPPSPRRFLVRWTTATVVERTKK